MIDDIIEINDQTKLNDFLEKWIKEKIKFTLKSLVDLKSLKEQNSSVRALAYQLYENNGVLKREKVFSYLKSLEQSDRKILRKFRCKIWKIPHIPF